MRRNKKHPTVEINRRRILQGLGALGLAAAGGHSGLALAETVTLPFSNGVRPLVQWPQKRPLIQLTTNAPQLETPFSVFNEGVITPNDAFFVRSSSPAVTDVNPLTFRLTVNGNVNQILTLTLADLKTQFTPREIVAVCQCAGNSRGFFAPRIRGGQWANGAMGNARWNGVSLRDVLNRAGVGTGAVQVAFNGLDFQAWHSSPDFEKALDINHALDGEVMIAYAMNGVDLPMLNGFPIRLVVPGYYGTYWVKHLNSISVVNTVYDTYYMTTSYRIPNNACACVPPGTTPASTVPINRMNVRSFITSLANGAVVRLGANVVRGIAFDGGSGIQSVLFSGDGGITWNAARLGVDMGKYSFRQWEADFIPQLTGSYTLMVRAINNLGQTQALDPLWNPSGYMRNVVETVQVNAVA